MPKTAYRALEWLCSTPGPLFEVGKMRKSFCFLLPIVCSCVFPISSLLQLQKQLGKSRGTIRLVSSVLHHLATCQPCQSCNSVTACAHIWIEPRQSVRPIKSSDSAQPKRVLENFRLSNSVCKDPIRNPEEQASFLIKGKLLLVMAKVASMAVVSHMLFLLV